MSAATIVRIGMIALALASGAGPALAAKKEADPATLSSDMLRDQGAAMLKARQGDKAIPMLSELVARQPRDGAAQTLLALAWHQAGASRGDALDLALAGYDLAARADPGTTWPAALAGRATFDQGRYAEASEHFARAVALRPDDARLLGSLAAAAYMAGDPTLAGIASARAVAVDGSRNPDLIRLAALAAAAGGDGEAARGYAKRLEAVAPALAATTGARIAQIEQLVHRFARVIPAVPNISPS